MKQAQDHSHGSIFDRPLYGVATEPFLTQYTRIKLE